MKQGLADRARSAAIALGIAVFQRGVIDQPARTAGLLHHRVAGIDAQRAGNAGDVRAVADIITGRADRDALVAVDAIAKVIGGLFGLFDRAARFAAPVLVGHDQALFIEHRGLDARPRAHVDADLLAHEPAENERRRSQHGDRRIGHRGGLSGPEINRQRRRIGEIHDPCPAGPETDDQIDRPLEGTPGDLARAPRRRLQPRLGIAIAIDEPVNVLEQVGPDRLRTGIAAPGPANRAGHQKQPNPGHDQQTGHEIEFLRPDFDPEHEEPAMGQIDQHRLIGRIGTAIPADPRGDVIDPQRHRHHQPFEAAERALYRFGEDRLPLFIESRTLTDLVRALHFRFRWQEGQAPPP